MRLNLALIYHCFLISFLVTLSLAGQRRCYTCRSRGSLGDCKDPFIFNSSLSNDRQSVVTHSPCPSGWCGKALEGKDDDHLQATHRLCLLTGPADSLERCSPIVRKSTKAFMCFCKGDLCNASSKCYLSRISIVCTVLIAFYLNFYH